MAICVEISCIWSVVSMLCHVGGGEEGSARHDVMSRLAVGRYGRNGMVFLATVYKYTIESMRRVILLLELELEGELREL
ncbi:hypothetical protein DAPPUDRAFT_252520 [Daphnia pulex]|uniref:Uncharacterized protein n=1 Tax=Daphnia pulex TaxID=6669 RepID=E9H2W2_DAPPU|nr:hypothetical protein DAPPUDRAFT_252520 [Daphnia pulex]|eukprot:EFX73943.1 hypothetical protein DAPPUDRAFT_252520 [Daphnia pulex]